MISIITVITIGEQIEKIETSIHNKEGITERDIQAAYAGHVTLLKTQKEVK